CGAGARTTGSTLSRVISAACLARQRSTRSRKRRKKPSVLFPAEQRRSRRKRYWFDHGETECGGRARGRLGGHAMPESSADHLLVIDGIKGESNDSKHPGAIAVHDFSWGNVNCGSAATGGGAGAGKVQFKDIKFHARSNIASPLLALCCASGKHFARGM